MRFHFTSFSLSLAVLLLAAGCQLGKLASGGDRTPVSVEEFDAFLASVQSLPPAKMEAASWKFIEKVRWQGGTPLVGESSVVFLLYDEQPRYVLGMMNLWKAQPLERIGNTPLQYKRFTVPPDSRIEYGFSTNHGDEYRDPLNQASGLAASRSSSVVHLPYYRLPPEYLPYDGPRGVVDTLVIDSQFLGYKRTVFVYTPAKKSAEPPNLLICGDGYSSIIGGHLPTQLDHLHGEGRISPTVAAMISTDTRRRPWEYEANRSYRQFVTSEVIPLIRERYGVSTDRHDVAIFGISLSGLMAADFILHHPELVANLAAFSPALRTNRTKLIHLWETSPPGNIRVYCTVGYFELPFSSETSAWLGLLRSQGTELVYHVPSDGHSWGHWRGELAPMLEMFFPATVETSKPLSRESEQ